MLTREWKPGDVAMVNEATGAEPEQVALCIKAGVTGEAEWRIARDLRVWSSVSVARPLVVIDPEDREQVERLAALLWPHYDANRQAHLHKADETAAALREFANPTPPKPDEPTGLGAVVEDAEGHRWVRYSDESGSFWINRHGVPRPYRLLAAVKVLSEGVTP